MDMDDLPPDSVIHAHQIRAAAALAQLLHFARGQGLPGLVWTLHGAAAGPGISGAAIPLPGGRPGQEDEECLETWCSALRMLLGPEDPDHGSGEHIFIYWPSFMGCSVMLIGERARHAELEAG
jgi:hypothetical protein